jgi:uncharacterized membrane protein (UPF0127 family)
MLKKSITLLFACFFIISAYGAAQNNQSKLPLGIVSINHAVFQVEIADNDATRMQGLSGRLALGKDKGMYFVFPFARTLSFWMKDMRFPLDIVWIKDNAVIGVSRDILSPASGTALQDLKRYNSPQPADSVLELDAGSARAAGIEVGNKVVFSPSIAR